MNWGSIVMGDKDANFDGIRVDAVDNVNLLASASTLHKLLP